MSHSSKSDKFLSRDVVAAAQILDDQLSSGNPTTFEALEAQAAAAMANFGVEGRESLDHLTSVLMQLDSDAHVEKRIKILSDACFYYQRTGRSFDGIPRGRSAVTLAKNGGHKNLERYANISLSSVYLDTGNFEDACRCLERALVLAREMGDPLLECSAYTMIGALLKEMGLYLDALEVIDKAFACNTQTAQGQQLRFVNANNGLFSAHRLGNHTAALKYMSVACETIENPLLDVATRATFENVRCMYLLAHNDEETADALITSARERAASVQNPRVEILLATAAALCDWASRDPVREARAKKQLRELHHKSKQTRLYHDDVLRALVQVHSRQPSGVEPHDDFDATIAAVISNSRIGIAYAKELVEYITSVKHAKFYRQMNDKGVGRPAHESAPPSAIFDPCVRLRDWLGQDPTTAPAEIAGAPPPRTVRKHDELTAVHDDLAKLRTASIRNTIRTNAYHTAENWALAAEFFDDQTGQHCFRVGRLAGMLAHEIGMDQEYCVRIEHAARLHDIGKISVNELILLKPGPLDPSEVTAMRAHAEVGAFLLQGSDDPTLQMAAVIARHHHEWWNGAGYPNSLAGERIPLEARICALADVYDALTNVRPYKRAWSHRESIEQMMLESAGHFDPRLVRPFLKVLERHVGSTAQPPSTQLHLQDMGANGLLASRRKLMEALNAE